MAAADAKICLKVFELNEDVWIAMVDSIHEFIDDCLILLACCPFPTQTKIRRICKQVLPPDTRSVLILVCFIQCLRQTRILAPRCRYQHQCKQARLEPERVHQRQHTGPASRWRYPCPEHQDLLAQGFANHLCKRHHRYQTSRQAAPPRSLLLDDKRMTCDNDHINFVSRPVVDH